MSQENPTAADIWKQLDAEESGAAPAPQEPAPQEAAPQEAAPQDAVDTGIVKEDDPYAGLPPQIREEMAGMKTLLTQLGGRLRQAEGHIGNLTGQLKRAKEEARTQPTAAQISAAHGDPEAWKALETEYPEFSKVMKSALDAQLSAVREEIEAIKSQPKPESPDVLQKLEATQRELLVEIRHPGWKDLVQTPQFVGWLNEQPREVQMLASSAEPRDAVRLLDLHSQARSNSGTRQQHLAAAAAIPSGRASSARPVPTDQMTGEQYWKYLDQLDAQKQSIHR